MAHLNRKTTPKVRDGKAQRKNRSVLTLNYWSTPRRGLRARARTGRLGPLPRDVRSDRL